MRFPKSCKLNLACKKDLGRYAMNAVHLEADPDAPDAGRLIATDGRMLAVVPVEIEEADRETATLGVLIPADAIKEAVKGRGGEARIDCNGSAVVHGAKGEKTTWEYGEGEFPRWRAIADRKAECETDPETGDAIPRQSVTLNPTLLLALAKALGSPEGVRIEFAPRADGSVLSPMLVEPVSAADGPARGREGYLMPITVSV